MNRREVLRKLLGAVAVALGTHLPFSRLGDADKSEIAFTTEPELHPVLAEIMETLVADEGAQTLAALTSTYATTSEADSDGESAPKEDSRLDTTDPRPAAQPESGLIEGPPALAEPPADEELRLHKIRRFDDVFADDVFLTSAEYEILVRTLKRIHRVQVHVGHGNFNILAFDDMLKYARRIPEIGHFREDEKALMERLFHDDARKLGFFGDKVIERITHRVSTREIIKFPRSGHYLYRGEALTLYRQLRKDIGDKLILTSGVRSVVKQYQLFMAKVVASAGNLSKASRSLAPPGHSYHGIGDFDVGKAGFHKYNFTAAFADTDVYRELQRLDYIAIRYTTRNRDGVRYEPWHMRVVV